MIHSSKNDNICYIPKAWETMIHSSTIDDLELYTKYWPWPTWIWWKKKHIWCLTAPAAGDASFQKAAQTLGSDVGCWMDVVGGKPMENPWKTHGKPMGYPYFKKPAWVTIVCHPEKKITPCCDDRPLKVVDSECEPAQTKRRSVSLLLFHL